ncbi:protein kinase domain-containing protein [Neptunicella marina]|uniref:non-specific serine/threonine protein kinase n=1 Tax=Neptunicella marina TaxID=2125989 RepID=A0A8J6IVP3_9ALTE|nr:protein kinase [Neptunicella marina]
MADILNQTIGRYEIKELIGEGAMASVYRAYDPEIDRSVAFKILKDDHCVDEEYLSRFMREAKAAGALSHSNIVTVFDVGKIEKSPYIMMELLEGKDLGETLNEKHKLSVTETLIIGIQLAKSLDYAHKMGIVHRDIKPDNIIVLPDGETIKVADFGIARISEAEEAQKTQVGSVLGTPRYMSPEQALGEEADGRSDLFSVGAIMYEMLTGKKAFDASNIGTLMTQITQKQPAPIQDFCPNIPAGLRQIILKLLNKKPNKRFQTGGELASALAKELSSLREQEAEQRKQKYVPLKIRWAIYMAAIVSVLMLITVSVIFNIQSKTMTQQAVDSGSSFAKFIATETAIPLLSEDWITLETFISEASSRDTFSYLIVTDRKGIVRGASDTRLVGKPYQPPEEEEIISDKDNIHTSSLMLENGSAVFNISAPILFQSTNVGQIILGLSQDSLDEVKSVTGWLMFLLALITVSSVAVVLFIFGGLLAKPLKILGQNISAFADGDYDSRVSLTRNDEIGELFDRFNMMASKIQLVLHPDSQHSNDDTRSSEDSMNEEITTNPIGLDESLSGDETVLASSLVKSPTETKNIDDNKQTPENKNAKTASKKPVKPTPESDNDATIIASSSAKIKTAVTKQAKQSKVITKKESESGEKSS